MNATVEHDGFSFLVRPDSQSGHRMPVHWWHEVVLWVHEVGHWARRVGRVVVSVTDWIGRNVILVLAAVLVALFSAGFSTGLSFLGFHLTAVLVAMCGGAVSVGVVAYRAGDPDA